MVTASCHCGGVRLRMKRKPRKLTECNCSLCRRYAALWAYFRRRSVEVICDRGMLETYQWRNGTLQFFRCRRCGCVTHHERRTRRADGSDTLAVNFRNVDEGQAVVGLPVRLLDGASSWRVLDEAVQPRLVRPLGGS